MSGAGATAHARDDPDRRFVDMVGKMLSRVSMRLKRSGLVPGAGSPERYRGLTTSSQARL